MKFLCDVHISHKIVAHLKSLGCESIHVNEILDKSETKDSAICRYADENDLILITKDSDFRDSFFVQRTPKKLIKINLGNIPNNELKIIFSENFDSLYKLYSRPNFLLEIDKENSKVIEME
jgi:predicted nuclease of predicted toxin-antitoxin system